MHKEFTFLYVLVLPIDPSKSLSFLVRGGRSSHRIGFCLIRWHKIFHRRPEPRSRRLKRPQREDGICGGLSLWSPALSRKRETYRLSMCHMRHESSVVCRLFCNAVRTCPHLSRHGHSLPASWLAWRLLGRSMGHEFAVWPICARFLRQVFSLSSPSGAFCGD